jgi:bifunctional DNase/RNase
MLEMKVRGLTLDPLSNMALVILRDLEGNKALPIWVGIPEANAIALEIEQVPTPRPMTHDLIKNIFEGINASVTRIVVNDLRDSTFYATIFLSLQGREFRVDSRPSDAIAIALRVKAPIYVTLDVIERAGSIDVGAQNSTPEDSERLKEWLDNIKPEDFGKL